MKAIPLEELVQKSQADLKLLDTLVEVARALRTPAGAAVEAVLFEQMGACALTIQRWEAKAQELDYPAGASA